VTESDASELPFDVRGHPEREIGMRVGDVMGDIEGRDGPDEVWVVGGATDRGLISGEALIGAKAIGEGLDGRVRVWDGKVVGHVRVLGETPVWGKVGERGGREILGGGEAGEEGRGLMEGGDGVVGGERGNTAAAVRGRLAVVEVREGGVGEGRIRIGWLGIDRIGETIGMGVEGRGR
jgi:hypothetical protein